MMKTAFSAVILTVLVFGFALTAFADPREGRQGPFGMTIQNGNAVMIDRNGFVIKHYTFFGDASRAEMYNNRVYVLRKSIVFVYDIKGTPVRQYMLPSHGNWIRD